MRSTVHPVQHLSTKADIRDQLLHWQVAPAGRNVEGTIGNHMEQQVVVPLSWMSVEALAREQEIAVLQ
jgi:hypothetical protein